MDSGSDRADGGETVTKRLSPSSQRARDAFHAGMAVLGGVVLEPDWLGKDTPHQCLCVNGHECSPRPSNVRDGIGICLRCARRDPDSARDDFYARVAEQGAVVLESTWLGARKPHLCRCSAGHECRPLPNNVQQGEGICRACADQNNPVTAQRKDAARREFFSGVAAQGGVVLEQEWLGVNKPHRCRCARGHECSPHPGAVKRGQGICLVCSWKSQSVVYLVRDPARHWIKFGITSREGLLRLDRHRRDGFTEVVRVEKELPVGTAPHVEQKIKLALAMAGEKPVQGREYFSDDSVPLVLNEIDQWIPAQIVPMVTLILAPKNSSPA